MIQKKVGEDWEDVPPILTDYGFDTLGYPIPAGEEVTWSTDWEWLYGKLPAGQYRLVLKITLVHSPGDFEEYTCMPHFLLAGESYDTPALASLQRSALNPIAME